jgi:signal transduction histidine kinase
MQKNPNSSQLKIERKNTDVSLIAERVKATETMRSANSKTQSQTNQLLKDERAEADARTASSRTDTKQTTDQLARERKLSDKATKQERSQADQAIGKERKIADELVGHVLDLERKITDDNLSAERASTDSRLEGASQSLESEIAEHTKTKTTLTSREEFLAIVSHDLRNPVGTASSYASFILDMEGLDEQVRTYTTAIKRNTDSALRLIADLVEIERFAHNKWHFKLTTYALGDLLNQTLQDFSTEAQLKKISLTRSPTTYAGDIQCDPERLMQVFSNLVSNAIKFTPPGGRIGLGAERHDDRIEFTVQDNGPGIPPDQVEQIFERFAQLKSKNRTGLGLGLYISKTIIEAMGGRIWVKSEPGQGCIFYFTFPTVS